ncbi:VIP peptides isoform X1 [Erpetoichthys calabaricus]|uniref:VIP peptides isoform X1 n=1 Tax=Erpetoichthys calabaricus TaxID=27687 RepID=UPI00109F214E|nr:VIP peptides isoform X1 [Erpetoichthys calabaricus]
MLQRKNSQILLLLALCSVLYSKAMGLPALGTYSSMRLGSTMGLDGDSDNDWTKSTSKQDSVPESYKLYYDLSNAADRATRHADGLFTSGYSKLLGQLSARRYLESLIGKRVSNDLLDEQMPVKRHSDAIFTDNYSRFRKQMAVKKYLNSVLAGKRSQEDMNPAGLPEDASINENFSENLDDVTVDDLLNHIPLTL